VDSIVFTLNDGGSRSQGTTSQKHDRTPLPVRPANGDDGLVLDRAIACVASRFTHTEPPQVFTEIGRHPRLFRTWLPFAGTLLLQGALPRVDAELVILRTAWNARCDYEWQQHVTLAARAGIADERLAAVRAGAEGDGWTIRQRLLLTAADQLHANRCMDGLTRARVEDELSTKEFVELCLLVGHYEMLAMLLNSRGVEPDAPRSHRTSDLGHCSPLAEGRTLET